MHDLAPSATRAEVRSLDAGLRSLELKASRPRKGSLVAQEYGRRDWFLRRLLAASDIGWLAVAMV
jgi:hypothetical protein